MALSAGTAFIDIVPKLDDFNQKLESGISKLSSRFSSIGGTLTKSLTLPIAALGAASVKAFTEQENADARLRQALKSTGGAAKVSFNELTKLASQLQKTTTFADDAVQGGQALLLTFTGIKNEVGEGNDIFNQATKTMLDMSTVLGQDLQASAIQLGKALNDPIRGVTALRRVGVSFTEQQQDQIKTLVESGRTLEAQKLILKELAVEFGGQAEAMAKTTSGRLKQSLNELGDAGEQVGAIIAPVISVISSGLSKVAQAFAGLPPGGQKVVVVLAGIAAAAGPVLLVTGKLIKAFQESVSTIRDVIRWFALRAAKSAAVVAGNAAEATSAGVATAANVSLTGSLVPLTAAQGAAAAAARTHDAALAGLASRAALARSSLLLFGKIALKAAAVVGAGWVVAQGALGRLRHGINGLVDKIDEGTASAEDMNKAFGSLSRGTGRLLEDSLAKSAQRLGEFVNSAEGIEKIGDSARDQIAELLGAAAATKDLGDDARNLNESWRIAREAMTGGAAAAGVVTEALGNASTKVLQFAGMTDDSFTSWRNSSVTNLNFVKASLDDLAGQANLTASQILASFRQQLEAQVAYTRNFEELVRRGLPEDFRRQLADMGQKGALLVAALAQANHQEFNAIVRTWSAAGVQAQATVREIAGIGAAVAALPTMHTITFVANTADLDAKLSRLEREERVSGVGVPGLQHGGIVTRPTLAVVGEAGPEAVIPLDRMSPSGSTGAVSVTVNVDGSVITERELSEVVRRAVLETRHRNGTAGLD